MEGLPPEVLDALRQVDRERASEPVMQEYRPSLKDRIAASMMPDERPSPERRRLAEGLSDLAYFAPGVGEAIAGDKIGRSTAEGDYMKALRAALGVIPGSGKIMGAAAQKALPKSEFDDVLELADRLHGHAVGGTVMGQAGDMKYGNEIDDALRLARQAGGRLRRAVGGPDEADEASRDAFLRRELEGSAPQEDPEAGMLTGKRAALMGAGMLPGSGIATAAGAFPTAEGGYEPSMGEDWRAGNYGSAALKGLGAAGDVVSAVPVVGTAAGAAMKLPLAVKLAMAAVPKAAGAADLMRFGRGEKVSGLTGAFAPASEPVRGQTMQEIGRLQKNGLSEKAGNIIADLRAKDPDFHHTAKFLMPNELEIVSRNPAMVGDMKRLLEVIPTAAQFASLSKAGAPKLGWYRGSTQALIDVFGPEDAPRFASLLAATSPQTSVESNLTNALNIWREWNAYGRPTDPKQIKAIMGRSVQGKKGEDSVLDAWVNNTISALSTKDPRKTVLSGPKVDSFFRNLADDVYRVTNDAWMANVSGVDQGLFRKSPTDKQLAAGDPGISAGYLAMNARQREAGHRIGLLPSEVQETGWSVAMPLMEMQNSTGVPARDLLQQGRLTRDAIAGTPDFETLFTQPQYADILHRAGYGPQLANLNPQVGKLSGVDEALRLTAGDERNLMKSAETLEQLGDIRGRESRAKEFYPGADFTTVTGAQPVEAIAGNGVGDFASMLTATPGSRDSHSNALLATFKDPQGHDIINRKMGLDTIATQSGRGFFQPRPGPDGVPKPPETNATGVTGFEVPVTKRGKVPEALQLALDYSAARRAAFLGQYGVPNIVEVPKTTGPNVSVKRPKKTSAETLISHSAAYPDTAAVDTGRGVHVLNLGKTPLGKEDEEAIAQHFFEQPTLKPGAEAPKKPAEPTFQRTDTGMTEGRGYVDYEGTDPRAPRPDLPIFAEENAGHGLVSRELQRRFNALPKKTQRVMDTDPDVLRQADDLLALRRQKDRTVGGARKDIDNLIELASRSGGNALIQAALDAYDKGGKPAMIAVLTAAGVAAPTYGLAATRDNKQR